MKMKYFLERYFQMMAYVYAYAILLKLSPEKMELIIELIRKLTGLETQLIQDLQKEIKH
jgi:hypothetical protein